MFYTELRKSARYAFCKLYGCQQCIILFALYFFAFNDLDVFCADNLLIAESVGSAWRDTS